MLYRRFPWFGVSMALCALSQVPATQIPTVPPDQVPERKPFDPLPPRSRKFVHMSKKGRAK